MMIKSIQFAFVGFIIILQCHVVSGQNGWKKLFNIEGINSIDFDDIQYHDDYLLIRGNSYLKKDSIWGLLLCAVDTNGLLLWQQTIFDTTKSSHIITNTPSRFAISNDNKLIIPSKFFNHNEIVQIVTDSFGNLLSSHSYPNTERTIYPLDVISWKDNNYIFGHVQRSNYRRDIYVARTSSLGFFEWIKYYGSIHYHENFGDVINNENGTFTVSGNRYTDDFSLEFDDENWCSPWIFTIDTAGNMLNQWRGEANDERTLGGGPFYRMADGSYILLSRDVIQAPFPYDEEWRVSPTITRLDSNYNLVWKRNLTDFTGLFDKFLDLEYEPRDDIFVAAGDMLVYYGSNSAESEVWVVKFNPDGDIIWNITDTLTYRQFDYHYTAGLTLSPSGTIYVAGFVDRGRNEGWILKVTPDGCTDTICTITSIADQFDMDKNQVRVYPNPSKDVMYVNLKNPPDHGYIILYDITGRPVLHQKLQETSNEIRHQLPAGLYFYSVSYNHMVLKSGKVVINQ